MKDKMNILILEDLASDAELAKREIGKTYSDFNSKVVDNEKEFREALKSFTPDLIISDYSMPDFDGLRALEITRENTQFMPFIILTGSMNEDTAVKCMKAGADDYVLKERIKRLGSAMTNAIKNKSIEGKHYNTLQNLKESEEKYRSLIEGSNDGIFLYYNNQFVLVNKKLEELFGYSIEEMSKPEFNILDLVAHKDHELIKQRDLQWKKGVFNNTKYQFTGISKTGKEIELEASVSYIGYKRGTAVQYILRDISDRIKAEKELRAAMEKAKESDQLKSAFLLNISHEIRTPMNGILGFVDLIVKPDVSEEDKMNYTKIIKQSSNRLLNTISDLIDLAHIETKQVKVSNSDVNLSEIMEYNYFIFEPIAKENDNQLILKNRDEQEIFAYLDKEKLNRILGNLLSNATKFTDQGRVEFGYNMKDDEIEFYVKDNGIGIPKDKHEAIFQSFVQADLSLTRAYEGTGLGLTITKAYVDLLGGKLRLDSEQGKGSEFLITIPIDQESKKSEVKVHKNKPLKEASILIVEDDRMSAEYLSELLKDQCQEVLLAKNGLIALEMVRDHPEIDQGTDPRNSRGTRRTRKETRDDRGDAGAGGGLPELLRGDPVPVPQPGVR